MSSGLRTPSPGPAPSGSNPKSPGPDSPKHVAVDVNDDIPVPNNKVYEERGELNELTDQEEEREERESSREEGEEDEYEDGKEEGEEAEDSEQPPLPPEAPPDNDGFDDGWQPVWDATYQAYYFYNSLTNETTWTNPRVPVADAIVGNPPLPLEDEPDPNLTYNPAIHGDYDPTAPYAQESATAIPGDEYTARGAFNRFTGKFQPAFSRRVPETFNDENKTRRQMEFYFDVDAAASTHDGRSLKAERQTRKLSRKEVKQFQEKRKARKEEKRKAWLRD